MGKIIEEKMNADADLSDSEYVIVDLKDLGLEEVLDDNNAPNALVQQRQDFLHEKYNSLESYQTHIKEEICASRYLYIKHATQKIKSKINSSNLCNFIKSKLIYYIDGQDISSEKLFLNILSYINLSRQDNLIARNIEIDRAYDAIYKMVLTFNLEFHQQISKGKYDIESEASKKCLREAEWDYNKINGSDLIKVKGKYTQEAWTEFDEMLEYLLRVDRLEEYKHVEGVEPCIAKLQIISNGLEQIEIKKCLLKNTDDFEDIIQLANEWKNFYTAQYNAIKKISWLIIQYEENKSGELDVDCIGEELMLLND